MDSARVGVNLIFADAEDRQAGRLTDRPFTSARDFWLSVWLKGR